MENQPLILITGATGFLGAYLIRRLLREGYALRSTYRPNSVFDLVGDLKDRITWVEADVENVFQLAEAMKGVDTVVHAAAMISFDPRDRKQLFRVNQTGTANVVNLALEHGVRRLIHISSVAALGRPKRDESISESHRWQEIPAPTYYGRSKFQAEREIWRGQAEGLSVAALYPSVILGAGRWTESTPQLFPLIDNGLTFFPSGRTGFVDARDVATAVVRVLERDVDGDRFLLNADNWTYQRLFGEIAQRLDRPTPKRRVASWQLSLLGRLSDFRTRLFGGNPLISHQKAQAIRTKWKYDNHQSVEALKLTYRPLDTTINDIARLYLQAKAEQEVRLPVYLLE